MKEITLNFERELQFTLHGERRTGFLRIEKLLFSPEQGRWECRWSLDHIYPETVSFRGDDPLQALATTLDFASSLIRGSELDGAGIFWQYEGDHGGLTFPMCEEHQWQRTPKA